MPLSQELLNRINTQYPQNTRGFYGPATIKQTKPTPTKYITPRQNIVQKAQAVSSQTFDISKTIASKIGSFAINRTKDVLGSAKLAFKTVPDIHKAVYVDKKVSDINRKIDASMQATIESYKAGKMTKDEYSRKLVDLSKAYQTSNKLNSMNTTGPTPQERGIAVVDTATNILSLGKLQLGSAVAKQTGKQVVSKELIKDASKIENLVMAVPAMRGLIERNTASLLKTEAGKLAGETTEQFIKRNLTQATIGLYMKQPLVYQMNVGSANDIYKSLIDNKYGSAVKQAAWMATQMINGGPLGGALKLGGKIATTTSKLSRGSGSFIDEMSKQIGTGKPEQIAEYLDNLKKTNPQEFAKAERVFRIVQATNLHVADNDAKIAAERAIQHWSDAGIDLTNVTPKKAVELFDNWTKAHQLKNNLIRTGQIKGVKPEDIDKYQVVRWDIDARNALADLVSSKSATPQEALDVVNTWKSMTGNGAGQNYLLMQKIETIIYNAAKNGKNSQAIADEIKDITAVSVSPKFIPSTIKKKFEKLGYAIAQPYRDGTGKKVTPSIDYKDTRKLITAVQTADQEVFDIATPPQKQFEYIANLLSKSGLSPEGTKEIAYRKLSEAVVERLNELDAAQRLGFKTGIGDDTVSGGKVIITKLAKYLDDRKPNKYLNLAVANRAPGPATTDIRQMTVSDIAKALDVPEKDAKQISKAIVDGYTKVPLEYRGLGDAIVDNLYKYNPLHKYYTRAQSAFRYTYNPFFRTQERTETKMLSHAQAGNLIWNKGKDELNRGAKLLDESGIFKTGLSGEAAQDLVLGRITANITPAQKRDLAGLAFSMAKAKGMSLEEMLTNNKEDVADALRVIVQYPNKGILNSSLARTMNIAFFPMRYNLKVTKLAAEILGKEPPVVQMAVLNSLLNLRDWLKSDEGIRWQSQHADALQVFQWLTPINSITYGLKLLTGGVNKPGDLGSLGGLPLGVITQILDSEGIININTPYVKPTTGEVMPKYIPQTTKAQAATALQDILGSMFTYPGRVLGLPGKQESLNKITRTLIDTKNQDFEKVQQDNRLTPLQKQWVKVLSGQGTNEDIDKLYNMPAQDQFNWYTIPPNMPIDTLVKPLPKPERRTGLSSKKASNSKSKKIAQPIPQR